MDIYTHCPASETDSFIIRLIEQSDAASLFECYNDRDAVKLMNDDNCDFGFYVDSIDEMEKTVEYWLDFYKKKCFVRFSVLDKQTNKAIGTIEGFGGETGVLRIDICSRFEKACFLSEILGFAINSFYGFFRNDYLVTKATPDARARRRALADAGWEYIDVFRNYRDYYLIKTRS